MPVQFVHANPPWVEKLRQRLDEMVNAQFDSPEFVSLFGSPLSLEAARWVATQMYFYTLNRRDCWAYVQARAPFDVKQSIWRHEEDELIHDERGGTDHITLMVKEAVALGLKAQEVEKSEPSPMVRAALYAWLHIASTDHWLAALTASHMLERRNNSTIVRGGGATKRWREKLIRELGIPGETLISSNVHLEADVEHSDIIWDTIARHVLDEKSYDTALEGAQECMQIDRAYRGALAYGIRERSRGLG
jgi:pyrroloquinoline quinone (PQQ) biosynthesis protein C